MKYLNYKKIVTGSLIAGGLVLSSCDDDDSSSNNDAPSSQVVQISFEVNGPLAFAPVLFTAHDGSFDFFDTGSEASSAVELMAELGNVDELKQLVPSSASMANSVAPTPSGQTFTVNLTVSDANRYFSFGGMALPTTDAFIGNNDPKQYDLRQLLADANGQPVVVEVSRMYDAGTEINDFATSPGNPLVGIEAGDAAAGAEENGVITLAEANFFDDFLNAGDFDVSSINPDGKTLATITITPLP